MLNHRWHFFQPWRKLTKKWHPQFQWLRFWAPNARGTGLTPGQGTKILHATSTAKKKRKIAYVPSVADKYHLGHYLGTTQGMMTFTCDPNQTASLPQPWLSIKNPRSKWDSISLGLTHDDRSPKPKYYTVKLFCSHHHRAMWPGKQIHCPFYHSHWELFLCTY